MQQHDSPFLFRETTEGEWHRLPVLNVGSVGCVEHIIQFARLQLFEGFSHTQVFAIGCSCKLYSKPRCEFASPPDSNVLPAPFCFHKIEVNRMLMFVAVNFDLGWHLTQSQVEPLGLNPFSNSGPVTFSHMAVAMDSIISGDGCVVPCCDIAVVVFFIYVFFHQYLRVDVLSIFEHLKCPRFIFDQHCLVTQFEQSLMSLRAVG